MYIILISLLVLFIILYNNKTEIYKNYLYNINKDFYKIIDKLESGNITTEYTPPELKEYIECINIKDINKNSNYILSEFISHLKLNKNITMNIEDLFIFDELNFSGSYFPSAHTDTEWNKIKNEGFQIWSLIKNDKSIGNMFILHNQYLYDKYKDDTIFLRLYKDKIAVVKNCYDAEILWHVKPSRIYELLSIDEFIKNTKKYYLDFKNGDSIMFAKNVIHMSDYRDKKSKREAFNFRVAKKNNNKIIVSNNKCGYVHSLNI